MEPLAAIEVKNLVAGYGESRILDNVGFYVRPREVFVILGGSGCGKSTLLRHMIGLEKPVSGHILVDGTDIITCADQDFCAVRRKIGVLFQSGALMGSMTVGENVALPIIEFSGLPPEAVKDLVKMKLKTVGLEDYEDHLPSEISGGMKKRAGLARALALNPGFLFLDEPSAGLDPATSAEIDDLIVGINETAGATIVIVTHELASIFRVAHRVIMLDKQAKGVIAEGKPRKLMKESDNPKVRQFFNPRSQKANA